MIKVYKISGFTIIICVLCILLALMTVWVFIDACTDPAKADNRLAGVITMGLIMLLFLAMAMIAIIELNDKVILTDDGIKLHLHRQTFSRPYSLKAIDDEILWKDIREVSFVEKEKTTFLVLELISGEVKEFGIGHIEKRALVDIESRLYPERYINEEEEEDADRPGSLEWAKRKALRMLLVWVAVEAAGAVLIAVGERWGIMLAFLALICGCFSLYRYYVYNSLLPNSLLVKRGRITISLVALLLLGLLVAAIVISDATIPPAG